jgi:hypothetical protein
MIATIVKREEVLVDVDNAVVVVAADGLPRRRFFFQRCVSSPNIIVIDDRRLANERE